MKAGVEASRLRPSTSREGQRRRLRVKALSARSRVWSARSLSGRGRHRSPASVNPFIVACE
jgi:hypothetical protein